MLREITCTIARGIAVAAFPLQIFIASMCRLRVSFISTESFVFFSGAMPPRRAVSWKRDSASRSFGIAIDSFCRHFLALPYRLCLCLAFLHLLLLPDISIIVWFMYSLVSWRYKIFATVKLVKSWILDASENIEREIGMENSVSIITNTFKWHSIVDLINTSWENHLIPFAIIHRCVLLLAVIFIFFYT